MSVALVVAAALAVKVIALFQLRDHPLLQPHGELDPAYYVDLARRIARDGWLAPADAFYVSPLYVYFLAGIFKAGGSLLAAQVVQVALGSAAVGLLLATARHWFGGRAALAAAMLAVATGLFTFYEVLVLQAALDPFLTACALYALTRAADTGRLRHFASAGGALALLALNRPNALAAAAAAAGVTILIAWRAGTSAPSLRARPLRPGLGRAAVLAGGLSVVLAANAARSAIVSGHAVLISSHGGLNLFIGNHEGADGTYSPLPGVSPSIAGQATDAARVAEAAEGRALSPDEVSAYFTREAWIWATSHPAGAVRLLWRKLAILINRVDVPLNYSYAYYARQPTILRGLAVGAWLLIPLGLTGLVWRSLHAGKRGYWLWASFVPAYGLSVVAFFVADRYRIPLFVPLCASAGAALIRGYDLLRARQLRPLRGPTLAVVALAVATSANLGLDNGIDGEQSRDASWLIEQGRFDEARQYAERVMADAGHPGVLAFRVGRAFLDAGRPGEAAGFLERALAIDGPRPAIRFELGKALAGVGRTGDAAAHLGAAFDAGYDIGASGPLLVRALALSGRPADAVRRLAAMPDAVAGTGAEIALDLGTIALEAGAPDEASRWLRLAVDRAPGLAEAHEKLGVAVFLRGQAAAALPHLEEACRLEPRRASAQLNLAAVLAALGRFDEARRHGEEAARLDPSEPRAAALLAALPRVR